MRSIHTAASPRKGSSKRALVWLVREMAGRLAITIALVIGAVLQAWLPIGVGVSDLALMLAVSHGRNHSADGTKGATGMTRIPTIASN